MKIKHEQEILRIKSEMNEEHKLEIIAKDDEIATLLSQNQQLQVQTGQNTANDRSNAHFFVIEYINSLFALDNGKEKVRRIVTDQINFRQKKILKFKDSVLAFHNERSNLVTVVQLIGLQE